MFEKICNLFTRLLPAWVILACITGYLHPNSLVTLKSHTDWLFALTMLGIGAVLNFGDFKPIFTKPKDVLLGTLAQFAIMPALGFAIAKLLRLPPALALGVILVGTVPGAMASNVISYLARVDVAYSIALTSCSTILSPILTPTLTYIYGRAFIEIKFWPMFFSIIKMIILPLLLGLGIKYYFKERLDSVAKIFPAISALFIALICGLVVALNRDYLLDVSLIIFAAVFLHNLFGLVLGYGAGKIYGFDRVRSRTLSIEVGMQNAGLGAVLSLKHFSSQSALPNALFATWCVITASILAEIWTKDSDVRG